MLLEALVIGTVIGLARGGKLARLGSVEYRMGQLLLFAVIIQSTALSSDVQEILGAGSFALIYLSYLFILVSLTLNFRDRALQGAFLGTALNFIVIIANTGMPVEVRYMEMITNKTQELHFQILHVPVSETTVFWFLGDYIPIPPPYPFSGLISPGDIILMVSVIVFLQGAMVSKRVIAGNVEDPESLDTKPLD